MSVRAERAPRGLALVLLATILGVGAFVLVYLGLTGELSDRTSWYAPTPPSCRSRSRWAASAWR